ncbi:MAG: Stk1 family PASTA domain-containing Ser/Thr kinase [Coriobacteriia bacterium]|nr:Stk1 family PASTA domain-containing Ser/Thr kinase [Coriobacteriia bacterium]
MEDLIFGRRYRVTEKIGTGGMADVYKAVDEVLGRTVAIKVMHPQFAADPAFAARFRQEAQAAANLVSPYIVNMYDWGQDGNTYYIVMEYVRGNDLKSLIQQRGALSAEKVADIGAQVCAALAVAHGYDIIHRDIKPHNIMVQPDGTVKVMDFGIARAGNSTMTQTGSVLGTAHYVSPEQAQGKELRGTSDLYSLGVALYEAATGKVPFDADTPVAVALKQVNEQPRPLRAINPNVDAGLEAVILKAMQKNPALRYNSADQMRRDLLQVAAGRVLLSAAAEAKPVVSASEQTSVMPPVGGAVGYSAPRNRTAPPKKRPAWPWIIAAVAVVLIAGLGTSWALQIGPFAPKTILLPNVIGQSQADAQNLLIQQGFPVTVTSEYSNDQTAGLVAAQTPSAGAKVKKGTEIKLVISKGPDLINVPNVVGFTEKAALETLKSAGFIPQALPGEFNKDVALGNVIRQQPGANTKAARGSVVNYVVSQGTELVQVPGVTNQAEAAATAALQKVGFVVLSKTDFSETVAKGLVISQDPQGGVSVAKGSTVTITVSKGTAFVAIPDVIGQKEAAATTTLKNAGFKVTVVYELHSNSGNVIDMSPKPPATGKAGDIIVITVDAKSTP